MFISRCRGARNLPEPAATLHWRYPHSSRKVVTRPEWAIRRGTRRRWNYLTALLTRIGNESRYAARASKCRPPLLPRLPSWANDITSLVVSFAATELMRRARFARPGIFDSARLVGSATAGPRRETTTDRLRQLGVSARERLINLRFLMGPCSLGTFVVAEFSSRALAALKLGSRVGFIARVVLSFYFKDTAPRFLMVER